MPTNLSPREERRGTRRLMVGGVVVAVVLGIVALALAFVPSEFGNPSPNGPNGIRQSQNEGESAAGRTTQPPPGAEYNATNRQTVGRAAEITATGHDIDLTAWQRNKIDDYVSQHANQRLDDVNFSIAIGAAVPEQAKLRDLSGELAEALPSFREDQYILVDGRLVIVEKPTRRITAIIPVAS